MRYKRSTLVASALAAAGLLLACPPPPPAGEGEGAAADLPPGAAEAAAGITAEELRADVAYLSSDELEGRGTASAGERLAREYLREQIEAIGLEPGGEAGGWEQPFEVIGITATVPATWTFRGSGGELTLATWDEFIAASGVQSETAAIADAELVFAGYGIQAPEYEWDDYKGADLEGKVLVMLNNDPEWDPGLFEGERRLYYGRWTYKYESAARQGAVGAIIIHTTPSAGYPYQVVQTSWTGEQFELPAGDEPRCQVEAWVTEDAARRLIELTGRDLDELVAAARSRDFAPVPLGVRTSLALTNRLNRVTTANVAGLLRGSDPELADEVVIYTAHYDHLGIGEPDDEGDRIYNGARDNATGVAMVLAAARAFTRLPEPPRRSLLFLFVAAEEQGLLGSAYYARHPTFPPGKIAANVNLDGGNIWGPARDVAYIGYGKSSLDAVVDAAAARQGRQVFGDQYPDRGSFYRSDQFNLAKIGVPAIYLGKSALFIDRPDDWGPQQVEEWEARSYHQPSDELEESWNLEGMIQDARLAFEAGLEIAQADGLPSWKPGDEFEAARLEALAAGD